WRPPASTTPGCSATLDSADGSLDESTPGGESAVPPSGPAGCSRKLSALRWAAKSTTTLSRSSWSSPASSARRVSHCSGGTWATSSTKMARALLALMTQTSPGPGYLCDELGRFVQAKNENFL